jgi:hypothetical protein
MHISLTVSAYVGIRKGCPMTYSINSDNQIEFSFGGARDGFDFSFDIEAMKELLKLGGEALAELDTRPAEGDAAPGMA